MMVGIMKKSEKFFKSFSHYVIESLSSYGENEFRAIQFLQHDLLKQL